MELKLTHNELQNALELIGRISTKHPTLPVLQCTRLEAKGEQVTLQATNLELSIEIPLKGTVLEPGVVAVPTQTLLQSIQFVTDPQVTMRTEEQVLQIETKTSNTSIKLFAVDEFPVLQQITNLGITIQGGQFSLGIKSAAFSASQTSIKPELGSVFIGQKKEHSLTFAATDSFRLMEKTVAQRGFTLMDGFMIPQKNALELARVCEYKNEDPLFGVDDNQCALRFVDGTYIATRLTTGTFPDYEQIIPKEYVTTVKLLKSDLVTACKKTNTFLNKFRQMTITISDGVVAVSSQNNDIGHTTSTIPAQVEGEDLTLNFNQQYIVDALTHLHSDSLELRFSGVGRPLVMVGVSEGSARYLVMPMNK